MGWQDDPIVGPPGAPSWASDPMAGPSPSQSALSGADTIRATPWYSQGLGGLVGMPGSGPSVDDVLSFLPAAGGIVGGTVGGAGGTAFGAGFGGIPGALEGAALGGASGEALRQNIRRGIGAAAPKTPGEAAAKIGTEAVVQTGTEALGRGAASVLRKSLSPFARMLDQPVIDAAARQGVDLPASALTASRVAPGLEAIASKGFGGGKVGERVTAANTELMRIADQTVARASSLPNASAAGKAIADGAKAYKANFQQLKERLYNEAALPEKGLKIQAANTVALLDKIIKTKEAAAGVLTSGPTADLTFYRGLREGLTKTIKGPNGQPTRILKDIEASALLATKRELQGKVFSAKVDPIALANKGTLQKLSATLEGEFRGGLQAQVPALAQKLRIADEAYKEGIGKINSSFGQSIKKLADAEKYDKIGDAVANSRMSVDDIPKIMEVAGPAGTEGLRTAVLSNMFSKATSGSGQAFTPFSLNKQINAFGEDRLQALLTPAQYATLKDLSTLTASMQKGAKIAEGSQTPFLTKHQAVLGSIVLGTAGAAGPLVAFKLLVGEIAFNRFIGSKVGQRWLTTGLRLPKGTVTSLTTAAHAATVPFGQEEEE